SRRSRAERKARIEAKKRARALVVYSPKILVETRRESAHIGSEEANKMALTGLRYVDEPPMIPALKPAKIPFDAAVKAPMKSLETHTKPLHVPHEPRDWGVRATAYGLFGCAVATNVSMALGTSLTFPVAILVARGIFAELGLLVVARRI